MKRTERRDAALNEVRFASLLLLLPLLGACGGGGGGGGNSFPVVVAPALPSDSGSTSTAFSPAAAPGARYALIAPSFSAYGALNGVAQTASGAVVQLNGYALTGIRAIQDIQGDAHFAMGRWVMGTVGDVTLSGMDGLAYHYVAFNILSEFPVGRTANCDTGRFTTPTFAGGGRRNELLVGTARGRAAVSFDLNGAAVGGALAITVGDETRSLTLETTVATPFDTPFTGNLPSVGTGTVVQVGDDGDGAIAIVAGYAVTLDSGARYLGVAKFRCA